MLVISLLLCGCAAQTAAQAPELTPAPLPTRSPAPTPYTIAWMSDTQHYYGRFEDTFPAMTAYLRDAADELNLAYVVHTGDIVARYASEAQWEAATRAMASLSRIPTGVCAGNHDVHGTRAEYENFCRYFGEAQCAYRDCYGESFEDNRGHYDLIDAGNTRYLFLFMGFGVNDAGLAWMKQVIESHPDRVVILCTHDYFDTNLSLRASGRLLHDEIVAAYPNVYMVLCGHRYNVANIDEAFDDDGDGAPDRTVHQLICNYQSAGSEGGSGYMMFFEVNEADDRIRVYTYSPVLDDYVCFDDVKAKSRRYSGAPESECTVLDIPWIG